MPHIFFVIYPSSCVLFRTSDGRTGSHPIQDQPVERVIGRILETLRLFPGEFTEERRCE